MPAALFPGKVAPEKRPVTPNDKKWPQFWKFRVIYSEMAQSRRPGWDKPEISTPRQKNCNGKVHPISCDCTVVSAVFLPWGGKQERGAHVRPCPCLGALSGATFWGSFSLCWGHFRGYLARKLAQLAEAAMLMRASQQRLASDDGTAPAQARSLADVDVYLP